MSGPYNLENRRNSLGFGRPAVTTSSISDLSDLSGIAGMSPAPVLVPSFITVWLPKTHHETVNILTDIHRNVTKFGCELAIIYYI